MMTEYRVEWRKCPMVNHPSSVLFIKAATTKDAEAIAIDHIERTHAITWFKVLNVSETKPVPKGEVL